MVAVFQKRACYVPTPISFLLKQCCDNNVVHYIQMIYTEVLCCLEHHFKAYTTIKNIFFYMFSSFYVATITPPTRL